MQAVLDQFHVTTADVATIVCRGKTVLRNPSNRQIADCLGLNEAVDSSQVHDLIVVGAGPAGSRLLCTRHPKDWTCWSIAATIVFLTSD